MISWRPSVQVDSSLSSVGLTASGAVGVVALALVLALGGCATKARSPAPPGNIEGADASAGTGARSRPIATPNPPTAAASQPGSTGADSSSNLAAERSEPTAGSEPSSASADVSGERGERAQDNGSSSASANASGEHGDLAAGEGASSASSDTSGERGEPSGVADNAAQSAQSATADEAGAASSPVAGGNAAVSSPADETQPAGRAAGSEASASGAVPESAAAMGSAQGETGVVAGVEGDRSSAGSHTVGAAAVAPATSGDDANSISGAATGDATSSAAPAGAAGEPGQGSSAAAAGAGAQLPGAVGGAPETRSGIGGGVAGLEGSEGAGASGERLAAVDVPSSKVNVDEEYRPQTLGGMLPLVLGVNEDGRFDFDQYVLRDEVKVVLDQLAVKLTSADYDRLDIIGYTDHIGTPEYNQRLSELRAWAVAQYLLSRGVPENKIHYEGRGEKNPLTRPDECTGLARDDLIACLQKDRRVEIEASIRRKHATVTQ